MINEALAKIQKIEESAFDKLNAKLEEEKIELLKETLTSESENIVNELVAYVLKNNFNIELQAQEISNVTKNTKWYRMTRPFGSL